MAFARALLEGHPGDRLARIAALFTFVTHLVDVPPSEDGGPRDGVDGLLSMAGENEGPAVILAALLEAAGEKAEIEEAGGVIFVAVGLEAADVVRVPPHAGLLLGLDVTAPGGIAYRLPLDPRQSRRPLGFLPRPVRDALALAHPRYRLTTAG